MTRWSLRRHRHRAQRPVTGAYRLDPVRPELESATAAGNRPDAPAPGGGYSANGYAPGDYPRDAYRADAYQPGAAAGYAMTQPGPAQEAAPEPPLPHAAGDAWPEIMEQFGLHLLVLAEQLRISLDELETDEADPERLQKLYKVDHAVTRMRRASRDLRILAGREQEELSGVDTSLLDVIRMALSAIERYAQVTIGKVADFGVLGYASDDVASMVAALLDNATKYSPGMTSISAHLTEDGSVLLRIEDGGIGMSLDGVAALNAMLAGDVPELDDRTGRHTGFPVVHRIARKYSIGVRLAARPAPGKGTIALATLPPELMCEIPEEAFDRPQSPPPPRTRQGSVSVLPTARRATEPPSGPVEGTGSGAAGGTARGLPRREPGSLRGGKPRPGSGFGSGSGSGGDGQAPGQSPEEQSAARRAFADDLTAFSLGGQDTAAEPGTVPAAGTPDPKGTLS
jgi:histidine kinase/DNA gyrase B/HSP90-like ATPase